MTNFNEDLSRMSVQNRNIPVARGPGFPHSEHCTNQWRTPPLKTVGLTTPLNVLKINYANACFPEYFPNTKTLIFLHLFNVNIVIQSVIELN